MRYVGIALAVVALLWCAQGFAVDTAIRNPNISLSPAGHSPFSRAQLQALEQAKAARNPMTVADPHAGWIDPSTAAGFSAGGGSEQGLKGGGNIITSGGGEQGGLRPLWGTNTTVMTGPLAWQSPACRPISFDFDSAGNFYALVDSASGNWPMRIFRSTDQGQTWSWIWGLSPSQKICNSKLIVVQKDSLFFYCFWVDTTGRAGVWRLNQSDLTNHDYILRADSAVNIAAAWDLDRYAPWFHVAIEKSGPENNQAIQYVRGTVQGTSWSAPSNVVLNSIFPSIATGNVGSVTNNIFVGSVWGAYPACDSAAHVSYDSSGIWIWRKIGGSTNRLEQHTQIAATHGHGTDSVRVWLAYTHWFFGTDPDILYSYNLQNGKGAWVLNNTPPGAGTNRQEWGASLNIPNWENVGGQQSFLNLSYYSDSGSTYRVEQNWLTNGYADPASWSTKAVVNDYPHSSASALSYATGALRGNLWSVVLYPGMGPTNVYFNGYWFTGVEQGPTMIAPQTGFELSSARPNPLTRTTSIAFSLPKSGSVDLAVYDIAGRKVATLAQGTMPAGSHEVSWNGAKAPAGVYLYRLSFEGKTLTNRMVVVR